MNEKVASLKLESFFLNKKLTKKSSMGFFGDVHTAEDLKATSTMVHKMVMLPKYEKIKSELRSANGVVNFVTFDEFEPLVENILKSAIPPNANDIYHMGQGFTLPEDYFVDAKGFFGEQSADQSEIGAALKKFEKIIRGSNKKMTRKWLKENGLDPDGEMFVNVFGEAAPLIRQALDRYETLMDNINKNPLKEDIDKLFRKLEDNRVNVQKYQEIAALNKGKPPTQQIELPTVLSNSEMAELRDQIRTKRGLFNRHRANIDKTPITPLATIGSLLEIPPDMFSQEGVFSDDGFLKWSPEDEIRRVYMDIVNPNIPPSTEELSREEQYNKMAEDMERKFKNLILKLSEYRTTDPDLIKKRQKIFDFLSVGGKGERFRKYKLNYGTFTALVNNFLSRASQHGKVMIFKNVENSALTTTQPSGENVTHRLNNVGVLSDFNAANHSNMVRDMEKSKGISSGRRAIILISTQPLSGMPKGSDKIEMDLTPIDEDEAAIIVNSFADAYVNEAANAETLRKAYEIENKYSGATSSEELAKKNMEIARISKEVFQAKTQLAYISPEGRNVMMQMIIGMGQKAAIGKVKKALASNIKIKANEDSGMIEEMKFEEKDMLKVMMEEFTKDKADAVPGLSMRTSKVTFKNYITKQESNWGQRVGFISQKASSMEMYNQEIEAWRSIVLRLDSEIKSGQFSPQAKQDKMDLRDRYEQAIVKKAKIIEGLRKSIPHYMILRGKPGVGKSVWGDALADLLGYPIYDVRIQDVFDKWVGNTEKNSKLLLNAVFNSRNCVYLIDEIDRVLDMESQDSGGSASAGGGHPTEKKVVADFLAKFGDEINKLIDRNVFVIMTTNHIRSIDNAMLKRAKGDVYDVQASDNPQDYLKFLQTFIETERKENPEAPWMLYGGDNYEEMWDFTMKYVKENVDLKRLAEVFATKQLSFRTLSGIIKEACMYDNSFKLEFADAIARGEKVNPVGMPMTTANMLQAAELADDDAIDSSQVNVGIHDIYTARINEANKVWPNVKLEAVEDIDPVTRKPRQRFKLPQDYVTLMEGKEPKKETQFEVADEELEHPNDPNVKVRQKVLRPYQPGDKKDMPTLVDEGMQEDTSLQTDQEKVNQGDKAEDPLKKKQQGKVTSSTEYLYRYLVNKGVIDNNGIVTSKKIEEKPVETENNVAQPFDSLEQFGTYYFQAGQIMMMSIDKNVPPLRFYN